MDIIVVASQKGGAGKTTLLRSLAVAVQQMGHATANPVADEKEIPTAPAGGDGYAAETGFGRRADIHVWVLSRPGDAIRRQATTGDRVRRAELGAG